MSHVLFQHKRQRDHFLSGAPLSLRCNSDSIVTNDSTGMTTPLAKALKAKGMNASELARTLNTSRQNVARWAKGSVELPRRWAREIAPILNVKVETLVLGAETDSLGVPLGVGSVRVRGGVAAGVWFEEDLAVQYDEEIPLVSGPWSRLEQSGFKVAGPSMDLLRIYDGDYVVSVPYFDARREPTPGDVVVVERRRGQLTERTVKQLAIDGAGYLLWPRSSDPRFQSPLTVDGHGEATEEDGTTVEITGLVIFRGGWVG